MKDKIEIKIGIKPEDLQFRVEEAITKEVMRMVDKESIQNKILAKIDLEIAKKADEALETLLNKKFAETNSWGEKQSEEETIIAHVMKKADSYLSARVGSDGSPSSYGTMTRLEYFMSKILSNKTGETIKLVAQKIEAEIKRSIK